MGVTESAQGVAFVPIASPLHDPQSTARVLSGYRMWLKGIYGEEAPLATSAQDIGRSHLGECTCILGLVLTGGTEQTLGALASLERPLLVLAHDSMNSFPAALEAMSATSSGRAKLILGRGIKQKKEVRLFSDAAQSLSRIASHRIGLVGGPSSWLTYSLPEADALFARLGIRVVEIPMDEVRRAYAASPVVETPLVGIDAKGGATREVSPSDLSKSDGVYRALKSISRKRRLTAISPRCFDFIKEFGATGCLALSRLNDEGIVAGCEGDIPSTVAMIALAEVAGAAAFMGNPSFIDGRRLVIAHCTVATKMTRSFHYRSHFESGLGLALAGEFKPKARVTVARFARGYGLLRAGEGTLVKGSPWSETLCRTQAEIRMDSPADVFWQRPMGNHLVMTYGDLVGDLRRLATVAGIEFEEV